MIAEDRAPSPEELQKTWRSLKLRMLNVAFKDRVLDAWTLRKVQQIGLYDCEIDPVEGRLDPEILSNPDHPRRIVLPSGPLVLYRTDDPEPKHTIVELSELALSDSRDIREAVLKNLSPMLEDSRFGITPRTTSELENNREALLSDDPAAWRPAALAISSTLNDDVLVALQGVRQCLEHTPVIQRGLSIYLPRVLYPTYSSFESIRPFHSPESLVDHLTEVQTRILSTAVSLREACSKFYREGGHLPLAPSISFPNLVMEWQKQHPDTDVWQEVWDWVGSDGGYLTGFHACTVFSAHPELVPKGENANLWDEILGILYGSSKQGEGSTEHVRWNLIHDLTKHYMYYIEACIPQGDGFKICSLAWMLAEQLASILDSAPEDLEFYLENWVQHALRISKHTWHVACSPISNTPLRSLMYTTHAPWAYSLACVIGERIETLLSKGVSTEVHEKLHKGLMSQIIPSLPLPLDPSESSIYACDLTLIPLVEKCTELLDVDQSVTLNEMLGFSRELSDPTYLCEEVRGLSKNTDLNQYLLLISLRNQAYRGIEIAEQLWPIVADENWWRRILDGIEPHVLELLMEGINAVQIRTGEDWFWRLPQLIANLCEKEENDKRRNDLFLYLIQLCLASDTVSALQRLLRGESKEKFLQIVEEYRSQLFVGSMKHPAWIAGRLRAILSVLRIE